ncbi:LysM peptidoglycan-binding domain-containing protein [Pseudoalteromonas sp. SG45-5]|uniref:LysM peptidoglycan-binding domain-containing protein n=1 Tax=unclassified Pseudoalteromonas TaxID=194690 RepID=UPI0015FB7F93|nr:MULTISPECIES: LysM peptidoglycan-binding domain-containing protein [unclassified Pseudoalteromonas]MBB1387433.1 LysM peptidoglycan-binding domain-containing protein [Pseudoalteromonas sp. SG45-5]MBB1395603.1 LysM peptidoglycan-binding domain-containing protein [Pseudoalteromonas sp. SG44-4]MBB1447347.1 LysM peptidoglycan-binding domain-containing protein [Pseudoalteromonas sp. SG41-6]
MFLNRYIGILPLIFILSGCETTPEQPAPKTIIKANPVVNQQSKAIEQIAPLNPKELDDVWQRIRAQLSFANSNHPDVNKRIAWYLSHPNYMDEISRRATPYLYHIVTEIEKRDLPIELALMPLIESDFDASAYSHKHASGLWQLTPSIAKYFKVKISPWYDGRQDVIDSTRAALDFMEYLYKRFDGDWYHAIAAYNLGEGRVLRSIKNNKRQGKPTDFFSLKLPKQTSQYVPKLLAAAQLLKSQKMVFPAIANKNTIAVIPVSGSVIIDNKEKWQQLESLNYGVIRFPAVIDAPHIVVLADEQIEFKTMLANQKSNDYSLWQHYTIQSGDSLSVIAKRYAITVNQLKAFNNLKSNRIRAGKKLILPILAEQEIEHKVKSGESLWKIAKYYKVSINKLKQWNNLSSDHLKIGKKLTVFLSNS